MLIEMSRPMIGPREQEAVRAVLESGRLAQGPMVERFETSFSALVGGRHCVAVSSGTAALLLSLLAHGIGSGQEVVVPSFTFAATANAVRLAGAEPVFADIDPQTFCLDPRAAAAVISARTSAIIPVHLFGQPADMRAIRGLAEAHGLLVVEDAAQAHGATDQGSPVGTLGHAAAFSFYATKNMTTGEGGMVVTADERIARRVRLLRNQGMDRPYAHELVGHNARMTETAAAIGLVQLERLPAFTRRRQAIAGVFDGAFGPLSGLTGPLTRAGATHVHHQYTVRLAERDAVQRRLAAAGVPTRVYYPTPVHRLAPFQGVTPSSPLPHTQAACDDVLSLPVGPHLSDRQVSFVVDHVVSAL